MPLLDLLTTLLDQISISSLFKDPDWRATHITLATAELLERILLNLPPRDLLLSQRVSKTWNTVIDNSVLLQQALFFKPAEAKNALKFEQEPRSGPVGLGIVSRLPMLRVTECVPLQDAIASGQSFRLEARLNNMLCSRDFYYESNGRIDVLVWNIDFRLRPQNGESVEIRREVIKHWKTYQQMEAEDQETFRPSYMHMYLTQPPSTQALLLDLDEEGSADVIRNENGVTLGNVLSSIEPREDLYCSGRFRVTLWYAFGAAPRLGEPCLIPFPEDWQLLEDRLEEREAIKTTSPREHATEYSREMGLGTMEDLSGWRE